FPHVSLFSLFFLSPLAPPHSTLFPYTTLFRSHPLAGRHRDLDHGSGLGRVHRQCGADRRLVGQPRNRVVGETAEMQHLPSLRDRSEEHTSELQSLRHLVCRLLLEKKKKKKKQL